jgi:TPR repeat protein
MDTADANYSSVYTELYTRCRCGISNVMAFEKLCTMMNDGDNIAKGYYALILFVNDLSTLPIDPTKGLKIMKDVLPWLLQQAEQWNENVNSSNSGDGFNLAHIWYLLGYCFASSFGMGIVYHNNSNQFSATHYLHLASDADHALGLCALGHCYLHSAEGLKVDKTRAFKLISSSANKGYPVAYHFLSMLYSSAAGCVASESQVLHYAQLAMDQGQTGGMYDLGIYHYNGSKGLPVDVSHAVNHYWEKGAEMGDVRCIRMIGVCYWYGEGKRKDLEKAFKYLKQAAELDNKRALMEVAHFYVTGVGGVRVSLVEAVRYLRRALVGAGLSKLNRSSASTQLLEVTNMGSYKEEVRAYMKSVLFEVVRIVVMSIL